jgi:probable F420-dependent oxidoreductase
VRISITTPVEDPRQAPRLFAAIEAAGYDGAFSFESRHDPFLPLAAAAATTSTLRLGTAVAIGFARNPMVLAETGNDLQLLTDGRFVLGLGSQIRPHIERRFSETWSAPARRMTELVSAIKAIWAAWSDGSTLDFQGEFYRHTLMTPAFDPGPNPFGPPPVLIGGFGPAMVAAAGEVADGLIVHPFTSRRSFEELTLPALDRGLARSGRARGDLDVVWVSTVVTWSSEAERVAAMASARSQFSFYGSTPAYRPPLDLHGWGDLQPELNRLSKQGRWDQMAELIPDELIETMAVVGPRHEIADRLAARTAGLADHVGLVNNRNPDPNHFADIVADLRRSPRKTPRP